MERRPVALVLIEGVTGIELVVEGHQPISHDLRDDRRAADDVAALVAMDEWSARDGDVRGPWAVDENALRRMREFLDRLLHGQEGRPEDVVPINRLSAHDADSHLGVFEDDGKGRFALRAGQPLGVVDANRQAGRA